MTVASYLIVIQVVTPAYTMINGFTIDMNDNSGIIFWAAKRLRNYCIDAVCLCVCVSVRSGCELLYWGCMSVYLSIRDDFKMA